MRIQAGLFGQFTAGGRHDALPVIAEKAAWQCKSAQVRFDTTFYQQYLQA